MRSERKRRLDQGQSTDVVLDVLSGLFLHVLSFMRAISYYSREIRFE